MPSWAVIVAQPNAESVVFGNAPPSFGLWWPRIRRVVSKRGKRTVLIRSLFPRYLFAPITDEWRRLCSMRGVHSLLLWHEQQPVVVPDHVIQEIKGRCDDAGFYRLAAGERFANRQSVTVQRGPFAGMIGLYVGSSNQREAALFEMLGAVRRIEFVHGDLIAA